jgi:excisionase family DNA binding protein
MREIFEGQKPKEHQDLVSVLASQIADEVSKRLNGLKEQPAMLSARTIAKLLDCSESEVRRMLQQNGIKTLRFGRRGYRVSREEFERHLARWKNGGTLWD